MSQSLIANYLHIIFSTKDRRSFLEDEDIRQRTQAYLGGICRWQNGYGAFSLSPTHIETVKKYISNQKQHHLKESFQDEYRRICKKYGVDIDDPGAPGLGLIIVNSF